MFSVRAIHIVREATGHTPDELRDRHRTGLLAPLAALVHLRARQLSYAEHALAQQITWLQHTLTRTVGNLTGGTDTCDLEPLRQDCAQVDLLTTRHGEALHLLLATLRQFTQAHAREAGDDPAAPPANGP